MMFQEKQLKQVKVITNPGPISQIVDDLKLRGYRHKFRREATCLSCIELNQWITPDSFIVDEYYRFEDSSRMDRDRTLYAISCSQGFKGFLVDTCFVYEDNISLEMMRKLELEYDSLDKNSAGGAGSKGA